MELKTNFIKCETRDVQTPQMQKLIACGKAEVFNAIAIQSAGNTLPKVAKASGVAVKLSVDVAEGLSPTSRIISLLEQIKQSGLRRGFSFPRELTCGYGVPNAHWTMPTMYEELVFMVGDLENVIAKVKEKHDVLLEALAVQKEDGCVLVSIEFNPHHYYNGSWDFKRWQQALYAIQREWGIVPQFKEGAYFAWY